ncbi:unnamed protein product [Callosobruchus maculatus]|uniref:HTH CENPB-type domain-containing protein n=1 Tax=Callosobruchus maculatus TaxID=64391 RepID=A0A653D4N4_CALMS|nr:unnamed protein product [Callosobruchus maculatus]
MENRRKHHQCGSTEQKVDQIEKENRPGKKRNEIKFFKYSENDLFRAVHSIKSGEISLNYASKLYGIPKSTLSNKLNKKVPMERKMGPTTILTKEEEEELVIWILNKAKLGFPLSGEDVKDSIQNVLKQCPRPNPFKDDRPGKKWLALFLSRHPEVVKRNAEAISKARATVTKHSITEWFAELKEYLHSTNAIDIFEDPKRILNCDETGCLTCPDTGKILGPKNYKNLYEISAGKQKEAITVLCNYSADGSTMPPMVVYPYKRMPDKIIKNMPDDWAVGRSDSGWMVSATFYEYVTKFMLPWLQKRQVKFPVILFLDGHKSHLSLQLSRFCSQNEIIVYCLPPNATHMMQPCDVSIFRPLKAAWKKVVRHSRQDRVTINKQNFCSFFKKAFDAVTADSIKNGFRACGLCPLDENAVDYSKCISVRRAEIENDSDDNEEKTPSNEDYKVAKSVVEYSIGVAKLQDFRNHLEQGTCAEGDDKSLFFFGKNAFPETDAINHPENNPNSAADDTKNQLVVILWGRNKQR